MSITSLARRAPRWCELTAEWGLLAYLVLLPLSHTAPWPVPSRAILIVAALSGLVTAAVRGAIRFPRSWIVGLFMVLVAIGSVSVLASVDVVASGAAASKVLLRSLVVFLIVACAPPDPARWRRLGLALATSGLTLSVVSLGLAAGGVRNPWGGLVGPLFDYNSLCMFLIPTLPFALATAGTASGIGRWFWFAGATVITTAIFLSFSRIGWAALAVLAVVWWTAHRAGRRVLLAVVAAGATLFAILAPDVRRIVSVTDNPRFLATANLEPSGAVMKTMRWKDLFTLNDRLRYAWAPALRIIRAHPWLGGGYGPDTFAQLAPRDGPLLPHEHNAILAVAVQSGIGAALTFGALLVLLTATAASAVRSTEARPPDQRALLAATLAALVAEYLFQGLGEPTNNGRMGILFAVLAALAATMVTPRDRELAMPLRRRPPAPAPLASPPSGATSPLPPRQARTASGSDP